MTLIISVETDECIIEEHEEDGRTLLHPHTNPDSFTIAQLRARVHRKWLTRIHSPQDTKKNKEEKQ